MILSGILTPAYFRGVSAEVIRFRGETGPSLELTARAAADMGQWSFLQKLNTVTGKSFIEINNERISRTSLVAGGVSPTFESLLQLSPLSLDTLATPSPVNQVFTRRSDRARFFTFFQQSPLPAVQQQLEALHLKGFIQLFPAFTPGGAALETAVLTTVSAVQAGSLNRRLDSELRSLIAEAREGDTAALQQLEVYYLAVLSLGQRLDWSLLSHLLSKTGALEEIAGLAELWRTYPADSDLLSVVMFMNGRPDLILHFVETFGKEAASFMSQTLPLGEGALETLFSRKQPVFTNPLLELIPYHPTIETFREWHVRWVADYPERGLFLKAFYFVLGGAFVTSGLLAFSKASFLRRTMGLRLGRNLSSGLVFASFAWVLLEPALFQRPSAPSHSFTIHFANLLPSALTSDSAMESFPIDQITLLILLMFFLLQVVIYTFCLIKVMEIRRRRESPEVKIRLLENEEVLFDSGLYVGLGGTVSALILLALGVVEASLMAAYASTLFGIIFVALLKIFHVRPYRQSLILQKTRGAGDGPA